MDDFDCARLARIMAGQSIGLVLSGGGARAYAHIGVVRALREAGVQLDMVGGTSMGAIVAACFGMGWVTRKSRTEFARRSSKPTRRRLRISGRGAIGGQRVQQRLPNISATS